MFDEPNTILDGDGTGKFLKEDFEVELFFHSLSRYLSNVTCFDLL